MNKILKLTFVLFLICAIVAGILGAVDLITRDRISAYQTAKSNAARTAVMPVNVPEGQALYTDLDLKDLGIPTTINANGQKIKILSVSEANDGSGYVVETEFSGAQGTIVMMVGVNHSPLHRHFHHPAFRDLGPGRQCRQRCGGGRELPRPVQGRGRACAAQEGRRRDRRALRRHHHLPQRDQRHLRGHPVRGSAAECELRREGHEL